MQFEVGIGIPRCRRTHHLLGRRRARAAVGLGQGDPQFLIRPMKNGIQKSVAVDIGLETFTDDLLTLNGLAIYLSRESAVILAEVQTDFGDGTTINISGHESKIGSPIAIDIAQLGLATKAGNGAFECKCRP